LEKQTEVEKRYGKERKGEKTKVKKISKKPPPPPPSTDYGKSDVRQQREFFTNKLNLHFRKKLVKLYR